MAISESIQVARREDLHKSNYTMGALRITGSIGGHRVDHYGTIQEVLAQVANEHPDFDVEAHYANVTASGAVDRLPEFTTQNQPLCCPVAGQPWVDGSIDEFIRGMNAMREREYLQCTIPIHGCARISCAGSSAIVVCNDKLHENRAFKCRDMAAMAEEIIYRCEHAGWNRRPQPYGAACGQLFGDDLYNVIIKQDQC